MDIIAYRVRIISDFYVHKHCHDEATRININKLTPKQINRDQKFFVEVSLDDVSEDTKCSVCHKLIKAR